MRLSQLQPWLSRAEPWAWHRAALLGWQLPSERHLQPKASPAKAAHCPVLLFLTCQGDRNIHMRLITKGSSSAFREDALAHMLTCTYTSVFSKKMARPPGQNQEQKMLQEMLILNWCFHAYQWSEPAARLWYLALLTQGQKLRFRLPPTGLLCEGRGTAVPVLISTHAKMFSLRG